MSADANTPERRTVRFESMRDILEDIETLAKGDAITSGDWTAGQLVNHIADAIHKSIDGYELLAPERERKIASRRRETLLVEGFPTGIKLEGEMTRYVPEPGVSFTAALENLRRAVGRVESERMEAVHPFLDRMDHEQWLRFHCRHAELHFSFLQPKVGAEA